MRQLIAFDFDDTILDDNSDTAILTLAGKDEIPLEIKRLHQAEGWTAFMQGVFTYLYEKGVSDEEIKNLVKGLPPVKGMINLITKLKKADSYDLIIISDSNSTFIQIWLENHEVENCFVKIFTNPSKVVDGMFTISPYQHQDHCKLSTKNMCKGQILDEFITSQKQDDVFYERVVYVGDGVNDFCPILQLESTDLACARSDHKLLDLIYKAREGKSLDNSGKPHVVKAELLVWSTGDDIMKYLQL